jgi:hypothetical protein
MKNKNLVFVVVLVAAVVAVGIFWLGMGKISTIPDDSNQMQTNAGNENTQNLASVIEKKPKILSDFLDDLFNQTEEIQLPKVDTISWQTYRNEILGVEFMYPKDWEIKEYKDDTFYAKICVKTIDNRFVKRLPGYVQNSKQEECIFRISPYAEQLKENTH